MAHLSQHDRHRPQGDLRLSERDPTHGCVQQCVRWLLRIFGLGGQSENLRLPEHSRLSKPADAAIGRRTPAFGGFPPALLRHPPAPLARRFRLPEWLDIGGRGRSRTYRGRLAPSNGFEVRASHRTRYSSALGLAEDLAATQHDASVSFAAGHRHLVEIFENLNCQIAPDTGVVLEGCGG